MRRLVLAFLFAFLSCTAPVFAYTSPGAPVGYVNDFSGVLTAQTKQDLETSLAAFEKQTSNEITVAVVPSLSGDYIENYAVRLFEEWGVGKANRDNGVLLLLATEDREMRIEVGYGLEGTLPDSLAQRILDNELRPRLQSGDYDAAITAGVRAIESATKGEYAPVDDTASTVVESIWKNIEFVVFVFLFALQWLGAILGRSKPWWPGGVIGIVAGVVLGVIFSLGLWSILFVVLGLGLFGSIFDYVVSNAYRGAINSGSTPPWWAGGSGRGFGSSRGGGFGGFGGGGSGGGGASGRW
jgi:uncharacterized protein